MFSDGCSAEAVPFALATAARLASAARISMASEAVTSLSEAVDSIRGVQTEPDCVVPVLGRKLYTMMFNEMLWSNVVKPFLNAE